MKIKKVTSLMQLKSLAASDKNYEKLLLVSAENLGKKCSKVDEAFDWLITNARESEMDNPGFDGEQGVLDEVNSLIKLL